jgi:hypothetical protein
MPEKPKRKVYRSAADWRTIRARYERSGLTQAAFCTREGVALHTFKKHYRTQSAAVLPPEQFVEVVPRPPTHPGWEMELTLPNGVRIVMRGTSHVE